MKRFLGLVLACSMLLPGCYAGRPNRGRALTVGVVATVVGSLAILGGSTLNTHCEDPDPGCDGPAAALGKLTLLAAGIPTTVIGVGYLSWGISLPADDADPAPPR